MNFIHRDPEFADLLRIVARDSGLSTALVEKDYWVTHTLWALHESRLEVWFKGGTSLSKGFGLIQRFSEDLDLKIEPGKISSLPVVTNWKSEGPTAIANRTAFFGALETHLEISDARVEVDRDQADSAARSAMFRVYYPGEFLPELHAVLRPFVLLEVGSARVTPFVLRPLLSFVHEWLEAHDQSSGWQDNRPRSVRCVHPMVTLLEKLDAISRRYPRPALEPAAFIRHYEDVAHIISSRESLPELEGGIAALEQEMLAQRQIGAPISLDDPAFTLADSARRQALERAWLAISPMFWGERISLEQCCEVTRAWVQALRGEQS